MNMHMCVYNIVYCQIRYYTHNSPDHIVNPTHRPATRVDLLLCLVLVPILSEYRAARRVVLVYVKVHLFRDRVTGLEVRVSILKV
jgi:hypothetical protein